MGLESGVGDAVTVDGDGHGDLVAAGVAAGGGGVAAQRTVAVALGRGQMVLEREGVHASVL